MVHCVVLSLSLRSQESGVRSRAERYASNATADYAS